MFDISFSELLVIGVVALVVLGPERLPKVARAVGLLTGRLQRHISSFKADLERQIQFEDLQKIQRDLQEQMQKTQQHVQQEIQQISSDLSNIHPTAPHNVEHTVPLADATSAKAFDGQSTATEHPQSALQPADTVKPTQGNQ